MEKIEKKRFIGIGKCSKYYLYILITVICKTLKNFIFKNELTPEEDGGIFGFVPELSGHFYVQYLYKYISLTIGGLVIQCISNKKQKSEKSNVDNNNIEKNDKNNDIQSLSEESLLRKKTLIFRDEMKNHKYNKVEIFLVCFAYCLSHELLKLLYLLKFDRLDLYSLEILWVLIFMKKYFVISVYNFKIVAIVIITVIATILLIISSFLKHRDNENRNINAFEYVEYFTGNMIYAIPIFIILAISEILLSYSRVRAKVLMDLKYLSRYKITFYIGICGTILIVICLIIFPFIECQGVIMKQICKVREESNNENNINAPVYIDNILFYLNHMREPDREIYIEIFVIIPLFLILNLVEFICEISVIYHFNPNYILVRDNLYYVIMRLCFVVINYADFNFEKDLSLTQFFILEFVEIISIFAFCIYLEIIELRFFGLDYYLKRNIIQRSKLNSFDQDANNSSEEAKLNNSAASEEDESPYEQNSVYE